MTAPYSQEESDFAAVFNSAGGGGTTLPGYENLPREDTPKTPLRAPQSAELVEEVDEDTPEEIDEVSEEETDGDESLSKLSKDELAKVVKQLRKENAKRRVASKNVDAKEREEFQKWKDSQLTEKERLENRIRELEAREAEAEHTKLIRSVAKKAGLSMELASRLQGETEDELLEDALTLSKIVGKRPVTSAPRTRGTSVGGRDSDVRDQSDAEWFRETFWNAT